MSLMQQEFAENMTDQGPWPLVPAVHLVSRGSGMRRPWAFGLCTWVLPLTAVSPFKKKKEYYLFLAVLGLCGCEQAFSQLLQVGATLLLWRSDFSLGSTGLVALRHMGTFRTRG